MKWLHPVILRKKKKQLYIGVHAEPHLLKPTLTFDKINIDILSNELLSV